MWCYQNELMVSNEKWGDSWERECRSWDHKFLKPPTQAWSTYTIFSWLDLDPLGAVWVCTDWFDWHLYHFSVSFVAPVMVGINDTLIIIISTWGDLQFLSVCSFTQLQPVLSRCLISQIIYYFHLFTTVTLIYILQVMSMHFKLFTSNVMPSAFNKFWTCSKEQSQVTFVTIVRWQLLTW